jgi:hypothetical protein
MCDASRSATAGAFSAANWNKGVGWYGPGTTCISASIVAYTASNGTIQNCLYRADERSRAIYDVWLGAYAVGAPNTDAYKKSIDEILK